MFILLNKAISWWSEVGRFNLNFWTEMKVKSMEGSLHLYRFFVSSWIIAHEVECLRERFNGKR